MLRWEDSQGLNNRWPGVGSYLMPSQFFTNVPIDETFESA